jgi:feruloyl esterase
MKFEQSLCASLLSSPAVLASPLDYPVANNGSDFGSKCSNIASKLAVENGNVYFSEFVAAGTNLSLSDSDPTCGPFSIVVPADICRVALSVATSNRSGLNMEAWLPSNWTGRFLSGGNGGLNGCVDYANLAYTSSLGFASVGTNNGHNGTSGKPFLNNPDVVEDFAYRA